MKDDTRTLHHRRCQVGGNEGNGMPVWPMAVDGRNKEWSGSGCWGRGMRLIIIIINPDLPFVVRTDTSTDGIRAILLQEDADGKRHIVEYAGKAFSDTQKRYAANEQEATAVMYALERWSHYLLGRKFKLEADHEPLKWLQTKQRSKGKLGRMALRLAEFDQMEIVHIPGRRNADADALSKMASINKVNGDSMISEGEITTNLAAEIGEMQDKDFKLEEATLKDPSKFSLRNGCWYFSEEPNWYRLCLPQSKLKEVLMFCHNENGHLRIDRTLELVRTRFYWPNLRDDVRNWVRKCCQCSTMKDTTPNPRISPMMKIEADILEPFQKVAIDILDLTKTTSGNKNVIILIIFRNGSKQSL
ncbi:hypothetical protein J437_LFUL004403 [Ladona fulva]|uniref:RNA-directed DNA polymerase n=1 Tax=Ladona fulva TaxID=123851 RepID=A0A8K0K323_LADFU|nr:hypothetical protein J437_LFUL004403 [Ladona fulva]